MNRVRKPEISPIWTGRKSKKRVLSVLVSREISLPRLSGASFRWIHSRFVVFPESPGP